MPSLSLDANEILELLDAMIRIDSALPHEEALARFVRDWLSDAGFDAEWQLVEAGRPNVCAQVRFAEPGPFLVFSGHSDTVPAAGDWASNPLEPVTESGRLYGLGAINMKAGLACMLAAFKSIAGAPALSAGLCGRLGVAVVVDQEGGSIGARALLKTDVGRCDAMLHAEHFHGTSHEDYLPSVGAGKVLYRVEVVGKAAHAFRPHLGGINAVVDAAELITTLDRLPIQDHPDFGRGTLCVLKIDGGYRQYSAVVPERCEIVITRLLTPGETVQGAVDDLQKLADRLRLRSAIRVGAQPPCYDSYALDLDDPIALALEASYEEVRGKLPVFGPHRGITDANVFAAEGGIPTVVFGPKGANHHLAGEYVEVESLLPTARIYAETALRYLRRSE